MLSPQICTRGELLSHLTRVLVLRLSLFVRPGLIHVECSLLVLLVSLAIWVTCSQNHLHSEKKNPQFHKSSQGNWLSTWDNCESEILTLHGPEKKPLCPLHSGKGRKRHAGQLGSWPQLGHQCSSLLHLIGHLQKGRMKPQGFGTPGRRTGKQSKCWLPPSLPRPSLGRSLPAGVLTPSHVLVVTPCKQLQEGSHPPRAQPTLLASQHYRRGSSATASVATAL